VLAPPSALALIIFEKGEAWRKQGGGWGDQVNFPGVEGGLRDIIFGMELTRNSWRGMVDRSRRESHIGWRYYRGWGIRVCERWKECANFVADMGESGPGGNTPSIG
jgi:hypothetical protein